MKRGEVPFVSHLLEKPENSRRMGVAFGRGPMGSPWTKLLGAKAGKGRKRYIAADDLPGFVWLGPCPLPVFRARDTFCSWLGHNEIL